MLRLSTPLACLLLLSLSAPARGEKEGEAPPAAEAKAPDEPSDDRPEQERKAEAAPTEAIPPAAPAPVAPAPAAPPPVPAEAGPAPVEAAPSPAPTPAAAGPVPVEAAPAPAPAPAAAVEAAPVAPAVAAPPPSPSPAADAPPAPRRPNELALEVGWNAPVGVGLRYLRALDDLNWSVGAGFSPATLWGYKVSVVFRHQAPSESGAFQQLSFGLTGGGATELTQTGADGLERALAITRTPGRTLDGVWGYRWGLGAWGIELFAGVSLRLRGAALQDLTKTQLVVSDDTRFALWVLQPGGISAGLAFGRRF